MVCAVMKKLCLVAIVLWLSVSAAVGTQQSLLYGKRNSAGGIKAMGCSNNTAVCQDGFELLPSQRCYFFSCTTDTWDGALETCRRMGATLAYPLNAVEDTILANHLKLKTSQAASWWLGASDTASEGQWVWAHDYSAIGYSNWATNQPDNSGNEDCLHYRDRGDGEGWKWNDITCTFLYTFVCQQL